MSTQKFSRLRIIHFPSKAVCKVQAVFLCPAKWAVLGVVVGAPLCPFPAPV